MSRIDRRRTLALVGAATVGLALTPRARAQAYPSKPIRVIVPFTAGDLADTIARLLAPRISEKFQGQTIVVDNKPGASGMIGLQQAMQADADGYTFVLGQMGGMAVAPNVNRQPFDVRKEFVAVAPAFSNYMLLVTHPSVPAKNLAELLAHAKAHPGQLRLATNGEGGFPHLAMELLKERSGIDYLHVPYKGAAQIPIDLIAGRVDMTILGYSSLIQHVNAGKLQAIATTGTRRPANSPTIATIGETVPGYAALGWFGFFARRGTPEPVIAAFNDAVNAALAAPDVLERARTLDIDPQPGTAQDLEKSWAQDFERWGRLIRSLGLGGK